MISHMGIKSKSNCLLDIWIYIFRNISKVTCIRELLLLFGIPGSHPAPPPPQAAHLRPLKDDSSGFLPLPPLPHPIR